VPPDRVAIYVTAPDLQLAAHQRARIERYAHAMGWSVVQRPEREDLSSLLAAAAARAFDRVLCWRISEIDLADTLLAALERHNVDLLAVAQSCAAMPE
jgi:DNA invertase Pin-like site-specific DNA recombinase